MDVVRRPAVVPEHDAVGLGERRRGTREAARVRARQEVDPLAHEELLHLAADQDPVAPVVADDELDTPAPRPRPLRPQREPAVGTDAHRRERARERDGKPDAERSRYSFQYFSSLTRKPRGVRRRAISSIMPGCPQA